MEMFKTVAALALFSTLFLATSNAVAQQVVSENNVQYVSEKGGENKNSVSLDVKKEESRTEKSVTPKKKRKRFGEPTSLEEAEAMLRDGGLRFRKKRDSNKCFVESKDECDKKEEENAQ